MPQHYRTRHMEATVDIPHGNEFVPKGGRFFATEIDAEDYKRKKKATDVPADETGKDAKQLPLREPAARASQGRAPRAPAGKADTAPAAPPAPVADQSANLVMKASDVGVAVPQGQSDSAS